MSDKFCVKCKHYSWLGTQCFHPMFGKDLVTGAKLSADCRNVRHHLSECGRDAKLFEQKPSLYHWILEKCSTKQ
jgi:hypothetical protein